MLLINAPSVLSFAWRVIQTFLDDVQKAKIKIMGSDPKEWQPVLFDLIDRDQVPQIYGGFAPDPTPESAFASMNPPADTVGFAKKSKQKAKAGSKGASASKPAAKTGAKSGGKAGGGGGGGKGGSGNADDTDSVSSVRSKASKAKNQSNGETGALAQQKPAKPFPWYHNICQVPLCKDGDDDFDFIVHFNSVPGDRRPVIETLDERLRNTAEIGTQTDDQFFVDVPGSGARGGGACSPGCVVA